MKNTRLPLLLLGISLLGACAGTPPQSSLLPAGTPIRLQINAHADDLLHIYIPSGEVAIEGDDVESVRASLDIRCSEDSGKCARWAADTELVSSRNGRQIRLGVNKKARADAEIKITVRIPRTMALDARLDYGELRIRALENDVTTKMIAGETSISMPRSAVDSVNLAARFGDVSMSVAGRNLDGDRSMLVGAKLDWRGGPGDGHVWAKLRYGEINVTLDR